jgi:hypothetical protein
MAKETNMNTYGRIIQSIHFLCGVDSVERPGLPYSGEIIADITHRPKDRLCTFVLFLTIKTSPTNRSSDLGRKQAVAMFNTSF